MLGDVKQKPMVMSRVMALDGLLTTDLLFGSIREVAILEPS